MLEVWLVFYNRNTIPPFIYRRKHPSRQCRAINAGGMDPRIHIPLAALRITTEVTRAGARHPPARTKRIHASTTTIRSSSCLQI